MNTLSLSRLMRRRIPAPRHAPRSRLAVPTTQLSSGLTFSDLLLLACMALAFVTACSTPLFGNKLYLTSLNHVPMGLLGPVLLFYVAGLHLTRGDPPWNAIFAACWPLMALALYALVGSSVAKWELHESDTYLTFGAYLMALPLFMAATPASQARARNFVAALMTIWIGAALACVAGEGVRFGGEGLHEIEYLPLSGLLALYYLSRSTSIRVVTIVLMIAAAALNQKLTGYIILAMALVHIGVAVGWRRLTPQWRSAYSVAAVVATLGIAAILTLLYFGFREYLPSGNADVRLRQYAAAWSQFVQSPVWGNAYLQNSGEDFTQSFRVINIPTHSDVLDLLKHGGLIALTLFMWGYWHICVILHRAVNTTMGDRLLNAYFVGMRFFAVTAFATFAINPLLLKGPYLVVIWGGLGLAVGLALRQRAVLPPIFLKVR